MKHQTKEQSDKALVARIKPLHDAQYKCSTWETWTVKNAPLMGGGRADITFDGCRKHGVALAK